MSPRHTGRIAVLLMLAAVAVYVGLLLLFVEPTPWRDVPEEGMSRNGIAYDPAIAELRLYRMPARGYPFFFEDELAPVAPLLRVGDGADIEATLGRLRPAADDRAAWCVQAKPESGLHVVTYRGDGSVFGYVIVYEAKLAANAPVELADCGAVVLGGAEGFDSWYVDGFFSWLRGIGLSV